ncbi:MAG: hypothetical protein JOZ99_04385 [Actinobacteria bacterium]|nr:hypothetical protein [Actinomycetota bacterium]
MALFVRATVTIAVVLAVTVVLTSPAIVYGEAQPLALSTRSGATRGDTVARGNGRIFYLSVVHERRAPWDVLADVIGRHDASAPRVAASPGPHSSSGDQWSRQAAIDAWQAAQRGALGTVQTAQPRAWPAVGSLHGDSAGLAYLLQYLDVLLPGDITGGVDLAATGVIGPDGSVEPVGGLDQKLAAARSAGVSVVFVPSMNDLARVPTSTARSDEFLTAVRASGLWPWQAPVVAALPYAADGVANRDRRGTVVVAVTEPVDALAWLCGYTGEAAPCRGAARLLTHNGV